MDVMPALETLEKFDRLIADLKLKLFDASPLKREADTLREAKHDFAAMTYEDRHAKWLHRLPEFALAESALSDLSRRLGY